jgi:hypothetical protein
VDSRLRRGHARTLLLRLSRRPSPRAVAVRAVEADRVLGALERTLLGRGPGPTSSDEVVVVSSLSSQRGRRGEKASLFFSERKMAFHRRLGGTNVTSHLLDATALFD